LKLLLLSILLVNSLLSFDYKLQPKEVSKDIYCFFGLAEVMDKRNNGNMSNSCFVNMGSSYLVIDSGPTFGFAQQAYTQMQKIKKLPISYVIDTHVHDDHWLGNSFYATLKNTKIVGSTAFKELPVLDVTRMQRRISKEAYKGTTQVFPTIFVDKEKTLIIDNQKVNIKSVNHKAHTDSDLYVYIPSKKVVFAGDLVFNERLPSLRDGDITGWLKILEKIKSMNVKYVIGGHGDVVSKDAVNFTYGYLKELREQVKKMLDDGDDIADVVNAVVMPEYKNVPFYDSIHRQNVETAYRTLEWENE
jgi:glyoxylase-like metal-dependent hydrolase (beta-lactamase superfamily II)